MFFCELKLIFNTNINLFQSYCLDCNCQFFQKQQVLKIFFILLTMLIFHPTRYFSVVAPGDTVHVIGEFDSQGKCDVNREKNFLIVHPDILVSGTRVLPIIHF